MFVDVLVVGFLGDDFDDVAQDHVTCIAVLPLGPLAQKGLFERAVCFDAGLPQNLIRVSI